MTYKEMLEKVDRLGSTDTVYIKSDDWQEVMSNAEAIQEENGDKEEAEVLSDMAEEMKEEKEIVVYRLDKTVNGYTYTKLTEKELQETIELYEVE